VNTSDTIIAWTPIPGGHSEFCVEPSCGGAPPGWDQSGRSTGGRFLHNLLPVSNFEDGYKLPELSDRSFILLEPYDN
jgi:hypothetical protein